MSSNFKPRPNADSEHIYQRLRAKLHPSIETEASPAARRTNLKNAAVLVPFFRSEDQLHILYTRRADTLSSHQGQVAFPGGKFDASDPNLMATALRECHEEIGIRPDIVEVLGRMDPVSTAISGFTVTPFVASIPYPHQLAPDPVEVAEIFSVPLQVLNDPGFRGNYQFRRDGETREFPAILYGGQTIWGLTLRITLRLLEMIA